MEVLAAVVILLQSLRVKTLRIFEDPIISGACGELALFFKATSYNLLKTVYIPDGAPALSTTA
jgi:hypothetical protein